MPSVVDAAASSYDNVGQLTVLNGAEGMSQMVVGALGQLEQVLPSLLKGLNIGGATTDEPAALNGLLSQRVSTDA